MSRSLTKPSEQIVSLINQALVDGNRKALVTGLMALKKNAPSGENVGIKSALKEAFEKKNLVVVGAYIAVFGRDNPSFKDAYEKRKKMLNGIGDGKGVEALSNLISRSDTSNLYGLEDVVQMPSRPQTASPVSASPSPIFDKREAVVTAPALPKQDVSVDVPVKKDPVDAVVEMIERSIKSSSVVDEERLERLVNKVGSDVRQNPRIAAALENAAKTECYDIIDAYFTKFGADKNFAGALVVAQKLFNGNAIDSEKSLQRYRDDILGRITSGPLKEKLLQGASVADEERQQVAEEKAEAERKAQAAEARRQKLEQQHLERDAEFRKMSEEMGLSDEEEVSLTEQQRDDQELKAYLASLDKRMEPSKAPKPKAVTNLQPSFSKAISPIILGPKITREQIEEELERGKEERAAKAVARKQQRSQDEIVALEREARSLDRSSLSHASHEEVRNVANKYLSPSSSQASLSSRSSDSASTSRASSSGSIPGSTPTPKIRSEQRVTFQEPETLARPKAGHGLPSGAPHRIQGQPLSPNSKQRQ